MEHNTLQVGIDVETGGLNPATDALLAIGIYAVGSRRKDDTGDPVPKDWDWNAAVLPVAGLRLEEEAVKLNGYSAECWEERGAQFEGVALVRLIEVLERWRRRSGAEGTVMVAHGAGFDSGFLYAALRRQDLVEAWEAVVQRRWRCSCATLGACMDAGILPPGGAGLDDLNAHRGLPRRTGVHDAGEDARLCLDGYQWLLEQMREGRSA